MFSKLSEGCITSAGGSTGAGAGVGSGSGSRSGSGWGVMGRIGDCTGSTVTFCLEAREVFQHFRLSTSAMASDRRDLLIGFSNTC
jgi:hypothetical protein